MVRHAGAEVDIASRGKSVEDAARQPPRGVHVYFEPPSHGEPPKLHRLEVESPRPSPERMRREVAHKLEAAGFTRIGQRGLFREKDVPAGTLGNILRQAG